MKKLMIAGALCASAATTMPAYAQAADGCTVIGSIPATIGAPGNYCMGANATVEMNSGAAISIEADNVTLDCRNFTLTNEATSNTGKSIGISAVSRYNLLVRNCRLVGGFTDAISLTQPMAAGNTTFYNRIENNYILGPYRYGIVANGSAVEVRNNTVYDVGGQATGVAMGIRLGAAAQSGARFQVVEDNLVAGVTSIANTGYGIYSSASIGSIFRRNTVTGTVGALPGYLSFGIRIASGSGNNVRDNHVVGRGRSNERGIQLPTDGGACFHNFIGVSQTPVSGCNTDHGNY